MATPNVVNVLRWSGRLCQNPTNLNAAYPHGGTALGVCRSMRFVFNYQTNLVEAEEWGGVVTQAYYVGERPYFAAVLREFDNDALNTIFPNTSVGTVSQNRVVTYEPDTGNRPGYTLGSKAIKLCFSPYSSTRHKFIILWYAIPALEETAELRGSLSEEVGLGVVWWAGVNSGAQCYGIGSAADLQATL